MSDRNGTDYFSIQLPKARVEFGEDRSVLFVPGDMADTFGDIRKQCEPLLKAEDEGAWWKALRSCVQEMLRRPPYLVEVTPGEAGAFFNEVELALAKKNAMRNDAWKSLLRLPSSTAAEVSED